MKAPPSWPLAPLLALASRREAEARGALGDALASAAALRAERERGREALREHRAAAEVAARRGPGPGASAASLAGRALHAARLAAEEARLAAALRRREAAVAAAAAESDRRRRALADARGAVGALEAGREAWRAARGRDRARADEDAVDEAVSARPGAGS